MDALKLQLERPKIQYNTCSRCKRSPLGQGINDARIELGSLSTLERDIHGQEVWKHVHQVPIAIGIQEGQILEFCIVEIR